MKFACENCGKKFDQYEECKNHENSCMTNKKTICLFEIYYDIS
jgi:hypothetical protein